MITTDLEWVSKLYKKAGNLEKSLLSYAFNFFRSAINLVCGIYDGGGISTGISSHHAKCWATPLA